MTSPSRDDSFDEATPVEDLIRRLGRLRHDEVAARADALRALLAHAAPEVRAEALGALFVVGRMHRWRAAAAMLLREDADVYVRSKAALALAATSEPDTRASDIRCLSAVVRDEREDAEVRRTAYEGLLVMFRRPDFPSDLRPFDPRRDVDWSWVAELELLYAS